jgi:hypothetical protein
MADFEKLSIKRIVVFGGTGAQGRPIVNRELSRSATDGTKLIY